MAKLDTIDISKAVQRITIRVKIKGLRRFKIRLWLGTRFLRLGAWLIGTAIEIDVDRATGKAQRTKIAEALDIARRYGGIDGAHHKTWVIDQMVRALTVGAYAQFVADAKAGEDGPETYSWDEGIAP